MPRKTSQACVHDALQEPLPVQAPIVLNDIPLLIRLEREVVEEFAEKMRVRLEEKIQELDDSLTGQVYPCELCGRQMENRGRKRSSFLCRFGRLIFHPTTYRCKPCKKSVRPLMDRMGVELGRISGSLARLMALLGVVVPFQLAANLVFQFFGVEVSTMAVWRAVQRLGEACDKHQEALSAYHADAHSTPVEPASAPEVVVAGVDGCALGMQVRTTRRHRESPDEVLPPLPPVEDGHFREVKTGVLLLPTQRTEPSPGRRALVRRVLVTCLGNADHVFDLLWSKLLVLGWLGPKTVVVVIGDGAEWIWNRASLFPSRCEILDFWHAVEKAWEFARLRYGEDSKTAARWISKLKDDLRAGRVETVIARLYTLKARSPEEQDKLDGFIKYYTDNACRMRYHEYIRLGYGIGSGAVESAHKQVVQARLRQAGMRWSVAGARRLLALRVLLLNNEWTMLDRLTMKSFAA